MLLPIAFELKLGNHPITPAIPRLRTCLVALFRTAIRIVINTLEMSNQRSVYFQDKVMQ